MILDLRKTIFFPFVQLFLRNTHPESNCFKDVVHSSYTSFLQCVEKAATGVFINRQNHAVSKVGERRSYLNTYVNVDWVNNNKYD